MQSYVDWFDWDGAKHPLSNAPEPKRRFTPSKWEAKKVYHCVFVTFGIVCQNNVMMYVLRPIS